jgi:dCMP deaminase
MQDVRPDWDVYFMGFAEAARLRATCDRKRVGAVIVVEHQVVATGYNGSVRRMPHCDEAGHDMVAGHCVRTIHAEMNALAQAARRGVAVEGAAIYTTASPCWGCFRVLVNAGLTRFVYGEQYRLEEDWGRIGEVATHLRLIVRCVAAQSRSSPFDDEFQGPRA